MSTRQTAEEIRRIVANVTGSIVLPYDMHTHHFPVEFGRNGAGPKAQLLTSFETFVAYHYLTREARRTPGVNATNFDALPLGDMARAVWHELFVARLPISAAAVTTVRTLSALGFDTSDLSYDAMARQVDGADQDELVRRTFEVARVKAAVMTNNPFEDEEWEVYARRVEWDRSRFIAALRLDALLEGPKKLAPALAARGVPVFETDADLQAIGRWLDGLQAYLRAVYVAVSFSGSFVYDPESSEAARMLRDVVIPFARRHGIAVFLMPEVIRAINPSAKLGGDGVDSKWELEQLRRILRENMDVQFMVMPLNMNTHYELAVNACAFQNLHPVSLWWFNLQPAIMRQVLSMRLEMLGAFALPMHSDGRHLLHEAMKWPMFWDLYGELLGDRYAGLAGSGWLVTEEKVRHQLGEQFSPPFIRVPTAAG